MRQAVKLCAIAMNEGPYLADWIFHHLHFGFDAVEIWINGTEDSSAAILERVRAAHPEVSFTDADELRNECVHNGSFFQYKAYAEMAAAAEADGFTHVAFLDLDEYWVPLDFESSIHSFLPERRQVNVVSFPWALDVPDAARHPFDNPFAGPLHVQRDPHVKSVVRLDDRVRQFRTHTARTTSGKRLLLREPFPLSDKRGQQWGSFVDEATYLAQWAEVPEAFVLHAIHRSQLEYVASMRKVIRRSPDESVYRTNRLGFGARARPVLVPALPQHRVAAYLAARDAFETRVGIAAELAAAREAMSQRCEQAIDDAVRDPALMERLRVALTGVDDPRLGEGSSDWDYRLEWHVDQTEYDDTALTLSGWVFSDVLNRDLELGVRDMRGAVVPAAEVAWGERPDVAAALRGAPIRCGFRAVFPTGPAFDAGTAELIARPVGAAAWSSAPSSSRAPRPA